MFVHPDCSFFHTFFVESIFIERTMPISTWPDLIVPVAGMAATQVPESEGWCGRPCTGDSLSCMYRSTFRRYVSLRCSCRHCFMAQGLFPSVRSRRNEMTALSHAYVRTIGDRRSPPDNCSSPPSSRALRVSLQRQRPCTALPGSTCH